MGIDDVSDGYESVALLLLSFSSCLRFPLFASYRLVAGPCRSSVFPLYRMVV